MAVYYRHECTCHGAVLYNNDRTRSYVHQDGTAPAGVRAVCVGNDAAGKALPQQHKAG